MELREGANRLLGVTMNREPEFEIERMLAPEAVGSTEDWQRVKDYLSRSFAAYLGEEVESVWEPRYEDISPTWGFSFGIRSRRPIGGPLCLEWYGVISHGHGHTEALVLLFAQDQRAIHFKGTEYLYFEFTPPAEGARRWESRGWRSSEMHEWESGHRLSEIDQVMRASGRKHAAEPLYGLDSH